MLRASSICRLARTAIGLPNVSPAAIASKTVQGCLPCISLVDFPATTSPLRAHVDGPNGKKVPVAKVVDDLHKALDKALSDYGSDRGVLSAPMLGYNARIVVVHCGLDRQTMINPIITLSSKQKIHAWQAEGQDMVRIARHRSIAVKYTTTHGDDETWYALPLEESEVLQRHFDMFDGFTVSDRIAPVRPPSNDHLPDAIVSAEERDGSLGVVPRSVFEKHEKDLMRFVEPVPRSLVYGC